MDIIKKLWKLIDGKKRDIAAAYWFVSGTLMLVWFPSGLPYPYNKINLSIGLCFTALGYGHAAFKKKIADKDSI